MRRLSDLGRRHLAERRLRAGLVGLSVTLGVAVLLGVTAGAATLDHGLDRISGSLAGRADVVASPAGPMGARLAVGTEQRIAAVEAVDDALALRAGLVTLGPREPGSVLRDVAVVGTGSHGLDLMGVVATEGRLPAARGEVVMDPSLADALGASPGDALFVGAGPGPPSSVLQLVGIVAPGAATASAGGDVAIVGLDTADDLAVPAEPVHVLVDLQAGTDVDRWIAEHRAALADLRLQDGDVLRSPLRDLFTGITNGMSAISAVALMLAAYLVYLAFSASVAQRTRTYGTLLALGASRRQVAGVVVAEVLWLAAAATIAGVVLGLLIARVLSGVMTGIFGLPSTPLTVDPVHVAVAAVAALVSTGVAAIAPARTAARLAPVAAIHGYPPAATPHRRSVVAGVVFLVAGLVVVLGAPADLSPPGTGLVLLGTAMALPAGLPLLARLLRPLVRWLSPGTGEIALAHLVKERSRSAFTAGLVITVFTVTLLSATGVRSVEPQFREFIRRQFGSDLQVDSGGFGIAGRPLPADYVERTRSLPGVAGATAMWHARAELAGVAGDRVLTVIDPQSHFDVAGYLLVDGDQPQLVEAFARGGEVMVPHDLAVEQGWSVGDRITLQVGGRAADLSIAATYASLGDDFARAIVIGRGDGERIIGLGGPNEVRVDVADGTSVEAVARSLPPTEDGRLRVRFGAANVAEAERQFQSVSTIFLVILAIAAIVGLLGMANTMVISVLERTREIGILRALGIRVREVRRMVLVEGLVLIGIALIASVGLSLVLAEGTLRGNPSTLLGFRSTVLRYPWPWLPFMAVAAAAATLVAGSIPARRAARLDAVSAIRLE